MARKFKSRAKKKTSSRSNGNRRKRSRSTRRRTATNGTGERGRYARKAERSVITFHNEALKLLRDYIQLKHDLMKSRASELLKEAANATEEGAIIHIDPSKDPIWSHAKQACDVAKALLEREASPEGASPTAKRKVRTMAAKIVPEVAVPSPAVTTTPAAPAAPSAVVTEVAPKKGKKTTKKTKTAK